MVADSKSQLRESRDVNTEDKRIDPKGKGGRGMNGEISIDIYIYIRILCIKIDINESLLYT